MSTIGSDIARPFRWAPTRAYGWGGRFSHGSRRVHQGVSRVSPHPRGETRFRNDRGPETSLRDGPTMTRWGRTTCTSRPETSPVRRAAVLSRTGGGRGAPTVFVWAHG